MLETERLTNELDLSAFWMPFTANRQFKADPRLFSSAEGVWLETIDGRRVLDGSSALWCVNAGHCRPEITAAVQRQLSTLDYQAPFQMGHPLAFELASRLTKITPQGLNRVFFTNSGSESVDTALKIVLAYHKARGEAGRVRFIGREKGYHGVGFGGMSVGGIVANRRTYASHLLPADHMPHTHDLARCAFSKGQPEQGAERAEALEELIAFHGAETIAAVIVEPMSGSGGVLIPPQGYLQKLREICDRHGLLLIFDEVITGFGRLGASFASDYFGVTPDLMTIAKGLTNGAIPMGGVVLRQEIHDALMNGPEHMIELFHGYTYSGHPVACAAALAALDIYAKDGLFARAADMAPAFEEAVHSLKGLPHVIDIRNLGLVAGVELEPRAGEPGKRGYEVFLDCFHKGLQLRVTGDTLALAPPLIIDRQEIDMAVDILGDAIRGVA